MTNQKPVLKFKNKTFRRSFRLAFNGIKLVFKYEKNMKVHCLASVLIVIFGLFFSLKQTEWLFLVIAITSVIFAEMVNTACERIVDLCTSEYNELAKQAKDIAAGAVLIATIGAVITGSVIFIPYLIEWLTN
ncbi:MULTISPECIES: diacylglycerol kinase family protein [Brochothrix]|uniref:Undecaprenol kinase n=1 Tax=Brochothrix thermosphacta TaxID=2756 RepID=A0A2X0RSL6_BROTH|nr:MULTISPECIES: diacylglycerol kinase family protein [Brochothrix]SLN05750.1 Diacylglycerol kinase [Brachybacterium faecium]ANZ94496.1 hypothetical protein BFC19_03335 [Brochothrix thermosphacta]ANZ97193.1 hypothetical protein BFC20_05400 [Brochothrix thermosphacta]EUJ35313.1 diacylglycerol kinase [Brochothrix thermosphacta DSM 20171 = FSL F6-1036]MDO7864950.1 diacylglycerol kinase family protein [Brochothrix thermosphacta]